MILVERSIAMSTVSSTFNERAIVIEGGGGTSSIENMLQRSVMLRFSLMLQNELVGIYNMLKQLGLLILWLVFVS